MPIDMNSYLFRISLTTTDGWSKYHGKTVKPLYYVCRTKKEAMYWGNNNTIKGVKVKSVSKIAVQLSMVDFSGNVK